MSRYITELIGTFFLVFTIGMVSTDGTAAAPLAIAAALTALVYMGGPVSGAHYNPAVTIAIYLRGSMERRDIVPYLAAQLFGAWLAASMVHLLTGGTFAPGPGPGYGAVEMMLAEIAFTFFLVLVILNVATTAASEGNQYYGLAIGFAVGGGAWAVGGVSGAAFNPAVGIGPTIVEVFAGNGTFGNLWIYIVGPFAGALGAVPVFRLQHPDEV